MQKCHAKIPQDFELLKQVPESSHQTGCFGVSQRFGTSILSQSAFPRIVSKINYYNTMDSILTKNGKSGEELKQQLPCI